MTYKTKIICQGQELEDFLDLPFTLYRNDPAWIAPIRPEVTRLLDVNKNPYFLGVDLQKFVCYNDDRPVARSIVVINPKHWIKFGKKTAFFGFYESENDVQATKSLFETIEKYCIEKKAAEYLEGPFNPNHYSELGLLVKNFTAPAFFETYNPKYYSMLLEGAGFKPVYQLHTRVIRDTGHLANRKLAEVSIHARKTGFTIRPLNVWRLRSEMDRIREVFNDAFDENWHFLPISRAEYLFSTKSMLMVTNPSLIQIVEHRGKPAGVLECVLNINPILAKMKGRLNFWSVFQFVRRRFAIQEIVVYAIGIKKEYRRGPVFGLLLEAFYKMAQHYRVIYNTWMSDSNAAAVRATEHAGLVPYKWFAIYAKNLGK